MTEVPFFFFLVSAPAAFLFLVSMSLLSLQFWSVVTILLSPELYCTGILWYLLIELFYLSVSLVFFKKGKYCHPSNTVNFLVILT